MTEWIRRSDLQVTSRERNPQFCGSPTRLKDRGFYTIQPDGKLLSFGFRGWSSMYNFRLRGRAASNVKNYPPPHKKEIIPLHRYIHYVLHAEGLQNDQNIMPHKCNTELNKEASVAEL